MSEEPPPLVPPQENITGTMNNIIEDNTAKIILQMIEKLSDKIERLTPQPTQKKINPKTGRPNQCYCHSCGCCDHWEKFCPNKKPGHIDSANFKDRKGGSNKGCLPNKEWRTGEMGESLDLRTKVDKLKITLSNSTSNFSPIASAKVKWKKYTNSMFANNTFTAKIDSGASKHFFKRTHLKFVKKH